MENVVKVTRRGQTTIPVEFRRKLGIKEGDQLMVEIVDQGILFKAIRRLELRGHLLEVWQRRRDQEGNRRDSRGILA